MKLRHLWDCWDEVANRLEDARHVVLLCDYDGTLTPIVQKPEIAELSAEVRTLLSALAGKEQHTVAVISGRSLRDIEDIVGVSGIIYAGNHGLEIEGKGLKFTHPVALESRDMIRNVYGSLHETMKSIEGVVLEDKGLTLSVHYRLVPPSMVPRIEELISSVLGSQINQSRVRLTRGKKVYEVRPVVQWDKGKAIAFVLDNLEREGYKAPMIPLFLGDDRTDEDGFAEVNSRGGVTIFVGEDNIEYSARFWLKSSSEVEELLRKLLDIEFPLNSAHTTID